ncbi:PIN domain-containing protein [Kitasatospora sp. LaBMicrA B282]|uniref:PIN domain-containing protein n=1 Tax=Kitasatospora sp. LaBMicrA B282 TaxID=3420949 RepID=UPI003D0E91C8
MIFLLDTNVVAELTTRPRPDPAVIGWARSVPATSFQLSVITIAEIEAGAAAHPEPARQAFLDRVLRGLRHEYRDRTAAIGVREAAAYLAVHRRLKQAGQSIDPPDALIGATALANGWTVATRNTKHLARTGALVFDPWTHRG